jgi:hypothetical protein
MKGPIRAEDIEAIGEAEKLFQPVVAELAAKPVSPLAMGFLLAMVRDAVSDWVKDPESERDLITYTWDVYSTFAQRAADWAEAWENAREGK